MVDDPKTDPPKAPAGETNEQKAEREAQERADNAAEQKVRGWMREELTAALSKLTPATPAPSASSSGAPKKRSSILDRILKG